DRRSRRARLPGQLGHGQARVRLEQLQEADVHVVQQLTYGFEAVARHLPSFPRHIRNSISAVAWKKAVLPSHSVVMAPFQLRTTAREASQRLPPHVFFLVSAVFHYLGPAFAVLLFPGLSPLGVAWLRIASAAVIFALWVRPWQTLSVASGPARRLMLILGIVLAAMNICFYLAI